MILSSYFLAFLDLTIYLFDALFLFLVLTPRVFFPHGDIGDGLPIGDLPSPPPCGWSLGFITDPLTVGLTPICLFLPALPHLTRLCAAFETSPIVA